MVGEKIHLIMAVVVIHSILNKASAYHLKGVNPVKSVPLPPLMTANWGEKLSELYLSLSSCLIDGVQRSFLKVGQLSGCRVLFGGHRGATGQRATTERNHEHEKPCTQLTETRRAACQLTFGVSHGVAVGHFLLVLTRRSNPARHL